MASRYQQEKQGGSIRMPFFLKKKSHIKKKKGVFVVESGRPLRRGEFNVKQARGVPVVRGDGWRTFGRLLHVSELFTRISGTCVRRGALPVAIGQRGGVRRKKKMVSGWNEFVGGNWGW